MRSTILRAFYGTQEGNSEFEILFVRIIDMDGVPYLYAQLHTNC